MIYWFPIKRMFHYVRAIAIYARFGFRVKIADVSLTFCFSLFCVFIVNRYVARLWHAVSVEQTKRSVEKVAGGPGQLSHLLKTQKKSKTSTDRGMAFDLTLNIQKLNSPQYCEKPQRFLPCAGNTNLLSLSRSKAKVSERARLIFSTTKTFFFLLFSFLYSSRDFSCIIFIDFSLTSHSCPIMTSILTHKSAISASFLNFFLRFNFLPPSQFN